MKKSIVALFVMACLIMTGCSNEFAKQEYDSPEKIAQKEDHYAKVGSVFNQVDGGYALTVSQFDGRQTLWTDTVEEEQEIVIEFSFSLSEGQAKIVHIDAEGNVTTIIECSPETPADEYIAKTVLLKSGENRLKIVGYDCENVDLEMLFTEP